MTNKKKGGGSKNYPAPFSLRLSKAERDELAKMADGRPVGEFIKDTIFRHGRRPPRSCSKTDRELLGKLLGALGQSRIASNINQLAKAANSGSLPANADVTAALWEAVEAIRWMRDTLIRGMRLKPDGKDETGGAP
ncbi:MAG: plasmid mobilization relaxosome protein MobC [Steroidobacteraceae bacterium]